MFENSFDEEKEKRGSTGLKIMLILGAILLLGVIFLVFWFTRPAQTATISSVPTIATDASTPKAAQGQQDPPAYWHTIQDQVAQGLHLSVAQVKTQLLPPPNARDSLGIAHVAAQKGISTAQLRVIELNAIQKGHDLLVSTGVLTKAGSDQGMQTIRNWDQATLDDHITRWFAN